jgi:hypothetical protein
MNNADRPDSASVECSGTFITGITGTTGTTGTTGC